MSKDRSWAAAAAAAAPPRATTTSAQRSRPRVVASIIGWATTFRLIPTILLSVSFGLLADKLGRKLSLFLSLLGVLLTLSWEVVVVYLADTVNLRWIWACGAFAVIGGGNAVLTATIYSIVNDVSSPEDRTTLFLYLGAADMVASLLASPLTYFAMRISAWFCISVAMSLCFFSLFVSLFMPETRSHDRKGTIGTAHDEATTPDALHEKIRRGYMEFTALLRDLLLGNVLLATTLFTVIFTNVGKTVSIILMQYAAKRFRWKWEEANLLNGLILLVGIAMTVVILPALDKFLRQKPGMTLLEKDLWLVRLSFTALFLGSLTVGLSSTPGFLIASLVIYGFGSANEPSMRGLIAQAAGERAASVFVIMTALELLGQAGASPLMARLLNVGMRWDGVWRALPFFVASLIFLTAAMVYCLIPFRLPEADVDDDTVNEEDML